MFYTRANYRWPPSNPPVRTGLSAGYIHFSTYLYMYTYTTALWQYLYL